MCKKIKGDLMNNDASFYKKWGYSTAQGGWTSVPNLLLKHSGRLNISPTELVILIQLMRFWWKEEDLPYPSISKTSEEMGVTRKTASKYFGLLKEKGYIRDIELPNGRIAYSLDGLIRTLDAISKEGE